MNTMPFPVKSPLLKLTLDRIAKNDPNGAKRALQAAGERFLPENMTLVGQPGTDVLNILVDDKPHLELNNTQTPDALPQNLKELAQVAMWLVEVFGPQPDMHLVSEHSV